VTKIRNPIVRETDVLVDGHEVVTENWRRSLILRLKGEPRPAIGWPYEVAIKAYRQWLSQQAPAIRLDGPRNRARRKGGRGPVARAT